MKSRMVTHPQGSSFSNFVVLRALVKMLPVSEVIMGINIGQFQFPRVNTLAHEGNST